MDYRPEFNCEENCGKWQAHFTRSTRRSGEHPGFVRFCPVWRSRLVRIIRG